MAICKVHPKALKRKHHCACFFAVLVWPALNNLNSTITQTHQNARDINIHDEKHSPIKQISVFTWKELSVTNSQKYRDDERCRQKDKITPFIHFLSCFSSCFVVRIILHTPVWSLNRPSALQDSSDNNTDKSNNILALVETKIERHK